MITTNTTELKKHLTTMVDAMPAFPESAHRVIEISSDFNCSPKDLVRVIERDPVMTIKLLKLVNSPFFALSRSISSVQHALVYLGLNTVKNLAVSIATVATLPRRSIPELSMSEFLTYSLATASVAQWIAKHGLNLRDTSDYFVGGLLHDFGKAVFIQFEPIAYGKLILEAKEKNRSLTSIETARMGVSSAEVGAMLAEKWTLPAELVNCIRMHANCNEESSDLALTAAIASTIVRTMQLGENGDPYIHDFSKLIRKRLGCNQEDVISAMQGLPEEVNTLKGAVN
ncbi:MAG: HDOD domain-containing protein [Mariprofundus sp.]|nr:HDOD domain-containing protein [Mariprofundus sp.]